jgi:hypothetical protein
MTKLLNRTLAAVAVAVLLPSLSAPVPATAGAHVGPVAAAATDYGPDTCLVGWVWREAYPGDVVCVTPAVRTQARVDNAAAASRVDPRGGTFGPKTCKPGYVWREARASDLVCVTPATRAQAKADNAAAAPRRNSVVVGMSRWTSGSTVTCDPPVCTTQNDGGVRRHRAVVANVNLGWVWLGLYRSTSTKSVWGTYVQAVRVGTRPGGVATFDTPQPVCPGRANAYFRARDKTSSRWSERIPVAYGCKTL